MPVGHEAPGTLPKDLLMQGSDSHGPSFEVIEVSSLPNTDRANRMLQASEDRLCGCRYCAADWSRISSTSVAVLESGIDLGDQEAINAYAANLGLEDEDLGWLLSLFGSEPITYIREPDQHVFSEGRHRVHALRVAGAERVAICTNRG